MKSILVDIDHTLSNAFWRDAMIGYSTWDEYHLASERDEPLHDVVDIIRILRSVYSIIGITARPEKFRMMTNRWCLLHQVPLDELLMRPDELFLPAPEIKLGLINKRFINPQQEIKLALEDREDCCNMLRGLGITVLQVFGRKV
jgi:hypothetical protein